MSKKNLILGQVAIASSMEYQYSGISYTNETETERDKRIAYNKRKREESTLNKSQKAKRTKKNSQAKQSRRANRKKK